MVCSRGSGRMEVMARLLAAGSFSQTMAGRKETLPLMCYASSSSSLLLLYMLDIK